MKRTKTRVSDPLQIFSIHEDRDGAWCVEYFDQAGRSYVTVFVGLKLSRARAIISMLSEVDS